MGGFGAEMNDESYDRGLGMDRKITRRDFLDGMAMTVGGAAVAMHVPEAGAQNTAGANYPPALTGLRGDQEQVFQYAHKLRDGKSWDSLGTIERTGENYDLVVVG